MLMNKSEKQPLKVFKSDVLLAFRSQDFFCSSCYTHFSLKCCKVLKSVRAAEPIKKLPSVQRHFKQKLSEKRESLLYMLRS